MIVPVAPDRAIVQFDEWPRAAAPGQAIAFYDGDVVLGGGVIAEVALPQEVAEGARPVPAAQPVRT